MESTDDLTSKNIKMLAEKISELTVAKIIFYLEETGAIYYYDETKSNKEDRLLYTFRDGNGSEEIRHFLCKIISEEFDHTDVGYFKKALAGSRFFIDDKPGGIRVFVDHSQVLDEQVPTHESYIEKHAPQDTFMRYNEAREALAEGDYSTSLHKCRMALDSLTTCSFGEALNQLHSAELITKIDPQKESSYTNKTREYRFLYSAWSWTSWLGSHTDQGREVKKHQAEVGIVLTAEVLYYLVKILKEQSPAGLECWVDI